MHGNTKIKFWLEVTITFRKPVRSANLTPVFLVFLCPQAKAEMLHKNPSCYRMFLLQPSRFVNSSKLTYR